MRVIKVSGPQEGGRVACDILEDCLGKGAKVLGLATGSSPISFYEEICRRQLDLSEVTSINLDEYVGLSPDSPQSYRHFMEEHLFQHRPMKANYLPDGQAEDLEETIEAYDSIIENHPIDLQVLGLGRNGHIGFNEPGTDFDLKTHLVSLAPSTLEANARFFDQPSDVPKQAISMGIASIMSAKTVLLLAYGQEKAEALAGMLQGPVTEDLPASVLQRHSDVIVIADQDALSLC